MDLRTKFYFKQIYKKWYFWTIIAVLLFALIFMDYALGYHESKSDTPQVTEPTEVVLSESDYKASCKTITYKDLARNPNKYKGEKFKFTGKVYSILKFNSDTKREHIYNMRIELTEDEYGFWDDVICASVNISEDEDKILEDDIITIWGEVNGEYTEKKYSSYSSYQSYPIIKVEYFKIHN